MHGPLGYYNLDDINVSEEEKNSFEYITNRMDWLIYNLVREKEYIHTARNLYAGKRDPEEFRYLQETFGIESPIEIKMTSLIKTRINVLVGLLLDKTFSFRISVNDAATITMIEDEKKQKKIELLKKHIEQPKPADPAAAKAAEEAFLSDKVLEEIQYTLNSTFISSFEKSAQHLIKHYRQSVNTAYKRKVKEFFKDVLIAGEGYYRVLPRAIGEEPVFQICKPENVFLSINTDHEFLKDGYDGHVNGVVYREFMSRSQILAKYGEFMTEDEKQALFSNNMLMSTAHALRHGRDLSNRYYIENENFHKQHYGPTNDVLPVYHVEYLASNVIKRTKEEIKDHAMVDRASEREYDPEEIGEHDYSVAYRVDRYEGIRIGFNIYLNIGKSEHAPRSSAHPERTTLTFNGVLLNIREGKPSSLCLELKDLQDTYDILTFYRDNLIANSGVDGSRVNLAAIPTALGTDFMERVLKFLALRKQGIELIDPTEEGASLFNHYGDFKASLNADAIQAIELVKESIEKQADMISGVNRYMYQAAEVRDAVENVRVGQQQVSLITKEIFELANEVQIHMLTDLINVSKVVYKKGLRGTYVAGVNTIAFDIQPEHFCFTDYNINVISEDIENNKISRLQALLPELVGKGALEDSALVEIAMSESSRDILLTVEASMRKRAKENDQLQQLTQALEQLKKEAQEKDKTLQSYEQKLQAMRSDELQLKREELQLKRQQADRDYSIRMRETVALERETEQEIEKDKEVVRLEREQLYATNVGTNAREVKNDL